MHSPLLLARRFPLVLLSLAYISMLSYSFPCFFFSFSFPSSTSLPPRSILPSLTGLTRHLFLTVSDFSPSSALSLVYIHGKKKKGGNSGRAGIGSPRAGFEFNYSSPHYIERERGTKITRLQLFSPESFRSPFYRRFNTTVDCTPRAHFTNLIFCSLFLLFLFFSLDTV